MRKTTVLFCASAFVLLVLLWAGSVLGGNLVGRILVKEFSENTRCFVSLENPRISLFPLRGTVENVVIRNLSDPHDKGFVVAGISVKLKLLPLLIKHVTLTELRLYGATSEFRNKQDGFYRTMDFLFGPPTPKVEKWHSFISSNWNIRVTDVSIVAGVKQRSQLSLYAGDSSFDMKDITAYIAHSNSPVDKDYGFAVKAKEFAVTTADGESVALGTLRGTGAILDGLIEFRQVALVDPLAAQAKQAGDTDILEVVGKILLAKGPREDHLELMFNANTPAPYLAMLFPDQSWVNIETKASGTIDGHFTAPTLNADLSLDFQPTIDPVATSACDIDRLQMQVKVDSNSLELSQIKLGEIGIDGSAALKFDETAFFNTHMRLVFNEYQDQVDACLEHLGRSEEERVVGLQQLFKLGLKDTNFTIDATGSLKPVTLDLIAKGQVDNSNLKDKLFFDAKVSLKDDVLNLHLQENRLYRGIEQVKVNNVEITGDRLQTEFKPAAQAELELEANYNLESEELSAANLRISHYPLKAILVRLYPFISSSSLDAISNMTTDESLIDLKFQGRGNLKDKILKADGQLVVAELKVTPDFVLAPLSMKVKADGSNLQIESIAAESDGLSLEGQLSVTAWNDLQGRLELSLPESKDVALWQKYLGDMKGSGNAALDIKGTVEAPVYSGNIELLTEMRPGQAPIASQVAIEGTGESVAIDGTLFGERATLHFSWPFEESGNVELQLAAKDFPLTYMMLSEEDEKKGSQPSRLTGGIDYNGARNNLLRGQGNIVIDSVVLVRSGVKVFNKKPLLASVKDGRMNFSDVELFADDLRLTLQGFVDQAQGWQAMLEGNWELGAFAAVAPVLEQFSGRAELALKIRGEPGEPTINGPIVVHDGSLSLPLGRSVVGIDDLEIDANFNGNDLVFNKISGSLGSGDLSGGGAITDITNTESRRMSFDIKADDVVLEPIDNLSVDFGGQLALRQSSENSYLLSGDMHITEALYEDKTSLVDIARMLTSFFMSPRRAPKPSFSANRRGDAESEWLLDFTLHAPGSLVIDTNVAQAELRSDLKISGSTDSPRVSGDLTAIDGTFGLGSNQFSIVNGQVLFNSQLTQIDPAINILGETVAVAPTGEESLVQIAVTGTLSNIKVSFSTDTGLSEREIIALLGGIGAEGEFGSIEIASASGEDQGLGELLSISSDLSLRQRLSGLTGIRDVKIVPTLSATTGTFTPRVVATRPLIRGVEAVLSTDLTEQDDNRARVDYELLPNLNLSTGWKSKPLTNENITGSFDLGFRYGVSFPGVSILPPLSSEKDKDVN